MVTTVVRHAAAIMMPSAITSVAAVGANQDSQDHCKFIGNNKDSWDYSKFTGNNRDSWDHCKFTGNNKD